VRLLPGHAYVTLTPAGAAEEPAGLLGPVDRAAGRLLARAQSPGVRRAANRLGFLGDGYVTLPPALVIGFLAGRRRRTLRPVVTIAAATAAAIVLSETTKAVTGLTRPRNWEAAVDYTGTEPLHRRIFAWTVGSFPSGHTVMATAVFGVTARMVRRHLGPGPATTAAEAAAAAAIATCAASRLALGVHWLSDIVGGVVVGEAAVRAVLAVERRLPRGRAGRRQ